MIDPLVGLFRLRFEAEIEAWSAQWAHTADPMVLWRYSDPAHGAAMLPAVPGAVAVDLDAVAGFRSTPAAVVGALQAILEARAAAFAAELLEVIEDVIHDGGTRAAMLPHLRPAVELWPGPGSDAPAEKLWRHVEATPSRRGKRWRGEALEVPHGLAWADLGPWFEEWRRGMTETEFALAYRGVTVTVRRPDGRPLAVSGEAMAWLREAERLARCDLSPAFVAGEALAAMRELVAPLDSPPAFVAAVRSTLDRDGSAVAVDAAKSSERVALWALELLSVARTFAQLLTCPATDGDARELVAGLMPWDAALVHRLEELGAAADTVQNLREKRAAMVANPPRELWAFWTSPSGGGPPRWVEWLARGLWLSRWLDAIRADLNDERRRAALRPAVTVRTMRATVPTLSPTTTAMRDDHGVTLVTATGEHAGRLELAELTRDLFAWHGSVVPADEARRVANELVKARATTAAVFTFLHAIRKVTELSRHGLAHRATWGSWNGWVEEVADVYAVKPTPDLRRLLCAAAWFGNAVQVPLFDGRTQRGLWTLTAPDPFKRGRPTWSTEVMFGYAPILTPEWAASENPTDRNRGVRLMAIPDRLPVGVRNAAIRGALYLFTLDLLAEVTMAPEPDRGLVVLPSRIEELGRAHGLASADAHAQDAAMQKDGLTERHGGRYRLADADARRLSAPRFVRNKPVRT